MRNQHFIRSVGAVSAAACFIVAIAAEGTPAAAKNPPASDAYPVVGSQDATDLQIELDRHGCYGNLVKAKDKTDRNFGTLSRKALWVFIDTYLERNAIKTNIKFTSPSLALSVLRSDEVRAAAPYCQSSKFLAAWYEDKNTEHIDGATQLPGQQGTTASGSCSKDEVGRGFLATVPDQYKFWAMQLGEPLEKVNENFDRIFSNRVVDFTAGMIDTPRDRFGDTPRDRMKKWGKQGVTNEETKKALQDAFSNFSKLIFAHGIVKYKTDCQVCYAINDWIYLRNIAQANGGYLVGKVEAITDSKAADGPVVGVGRALVESITMTMLSSIQSSIKTYRSITANLNQQLDNLPLSPTKDIADKIRVLGDARDQEMGLMVAALLSASQKDRLADETNKSNKNSLMSTLYRSYSCSGFDGSSVDQ